MEFDKSKIYSAINADELEIGSKAIFADTYGDLKQCFFGNEKPKKLLEVLDEYTQFRFKTDDTYFALAYLVEEPAKLKWTDIKIGDVIKNGENTSMVVSIDSNSDDCHIFAGDIWISDDELEEWEKV